MSRNAASAYSLLGTSDNNINRRPSIISTPAHPLELDAVFSLREIEAKWQELEAQSIPSPFQQLSWVRSYLESYEDTDHHKAGSKPLFICGHVNSKLILVVPLLIEKSLFGTTLKWLASDVSDYNGMIIHPSFKCYLRNGFLDQLSSYLKQHLPEADALILTKIPQSDGNCNLYHGGAAIIQDAEYSSHILELRKDWSVLKTHLRSPKSWSRLRSKYRSLQNSGKITFKRIQNRHQAEQIAEQVLEWKSAQLEERGSPNPFGTRRDPSLLRTTIMKSVADECPSSLSVFCLLQNDKPVAGILAFLSRGVFYYLVAAYSKEVPAKYSIGTHLLVKTLEFSARLGLKHYDFLIGDEPYKYEWANQQLNLKHVTQPLSLKGYIICYTTGMYLGLKKFVVTSPQLNKKVQGLRKLRGSFYSEKKTL